MSRLLIILTIAVSSVFTAKAQSNADSVLICKSKRAYAYHRYECRGLKHCTYTVIKMTKAQAIKMGYRACKVCYR